MSFTRIEINELTEGIADDTKTTFLAADQDQGGSVFTTFKFKLVNLLSAFGIRLPQRTIHAISNQELQDKMGSATLNIPDNGSFEIHKDFTFTQNQGFKPGENARIFLHASSFNIAHNYDNAAEPLIENADPLKLISDIQLKGLLYISSTPQANTVFNTKQQAIASTRIESCRFINPKSLGALEGGLGLEIIDSGITNADEPTMLKQATIFHERVSLLSLAIAPKAGRTQYNIVSDVAQTLKVLNSQTSLLDNESGYFIDPNTSQLSSFAFRGIKLFNLNSQLLKKGIVAQYTAVTDESGNARFAATGHGINDDEQVAIVSGVYAGITGKAIVINVNEFEIEGVLFVGDGAGDLTTSSLGYDTVFGSPTENDFIGDPRIIIEDVTGLSDTMNSAEMLTSGTVVVNGTGQQGNFVEIQDLTPDPADFIKDPSTKNMDIDTENGTITIKVKKTGTYDIKYSCAAVADTGPSQSIGIAVFINGIEQTKSLKSIVDTPGTILYIGGNFDLKENDVVDLRKKNITNQNHTQITGYSLVVSPRGQ